MSEPLRKYWLKLQPYLHKRNYLIAGAAFLVLVGGVFAYNKFIAPSDRQNDPEAGLREVELETVAGLSLDRGEIPVSGKVRSSSEVVIRAEAQGVVRAVYRKVGDYLRAGETIAVLDNASQYSDLLRAQAALESAEASYDKLKSGERPENVDISRMGLERETQSLNETITSVKNTVRTSYVTSDDIIHNKIDQFFDNGRTYNPSFNLPTTNFSLKYDLQTKRVELEKMLNDWGRLSSESKNEDPISLINRSKDNLNKIRDFLDNVAIIVNEQTANPIYSQLVIDKYKSDVSVSRSNLNTSINSLSSMADAYNARKAAAGITEQQYKITAMGAREEDLMVAASGVKQARAGLLSAQNNYNKTIIKSPIAGTLNSFDLHTGDYVSPMQSVAFVSNNNQLEVVTHVTENEAKDLAIGNKVKVGQAEGTVVSIAPALDPVTKKIEVKVVVTKNQDKVTNGQSVSLSIVRADNGTTSPALDLPEELMIPLTALKIEPEQNVVFTVNSQGILEAKAVTQGPIVGDKIIIEGIDPLTKIVVDARGLKEGDKVKVKGS